MHPLDASLDLSPAAHTPPGVAAAFTCRASDRYRNAIGPFGGWIAALLLKSVLSVPEARGAPLALDALFMGGMNNDDIEVRVFPLRQNRSVGFWRSEIWQAGRICAHAQVTLSTARQSAVLQDARFPDVPRPDAVAIYDNPRTPVPWVDQYVFKAVSGVLFSRAETMDARLWIRDAEARPLDAVSLTAICDTPFPSPWIRLAGQVPVSTVTYSVYYRASEADFAETGAGFCLLDSRASLAQGGYTDQFTSVWSGSGRLLAQTQQMLWLADAPADVNASSWVA
jgi:acyl-CoA thioesterase